MICCLGKNNKKKKFLTFYQIKIYFDLPCLVQIYLKLLPFILDKFKIFIFKINKHNEALQLIFVIQKNQITKLQKEKIKFYFQNKQKLK